MGNIIARHGGGGSGGAEGGGAEGLASISYAKNNYNLFTGRMGGRMLS